MQSQKKASRGRLKNTGHVDVTEYNYIKYLLGKSKGSQADVARMVRRSESLISYIARSKQYDDYCKQREIISAKLPQNTQTSLFTTTATKPLKEENHDDKKPEGVYKPDQTKKDYTGAILSVVGDIRSHVNESKQYLKIIVLTNIFMWIIMFLSFISTLYK